MPLKLIPPGGRKGYRFFYVRGTFNGKEVEVSTETTSRRAAERFLEDLPATLRAASDLKRETATFGDAAGLYIAYRSPAKADQRYIAAVRKKLESKLLSEITGATLIGVANELYPTAEASTKNRHILVPAAAILHHAAENKICAWVRVKKFKEPNPESRDINPNLALVAMRSARGPLKLLLTWLFRVGTRITETLGARLEKVDRSAGTIKLKIGKTDSWEIFPLPPEVLELLPEGEEGYVFPWRSRGGADKHRRALCKKIGIKFTFHQCRHTFGTTIVNNGQSLDPLPHWKDPKSRARYGRPDIERVREVMAYSGKIRGRVKKAQ